MMSDEEFNSLEYDEIKTMEDMTALKGASITDIEPTYAGYYENGVQVVCGVILYVTMTDKSQRVFMVDCPEPWEIESNKPISILLSMIKE